MKISSHNGSIHGSILRIKPPFLAIMHKIAPIKTSLSGLITEELWGKLIENGGGNGFVVCCCQSIVVHYLLVKGNERRR